MTQAIGAVMVAGGGVAGIQAALDLADSGFFVYVIEKTPGIGGAMAQLDKTFPTTDCSMCILAPYLVTAGRLESVSGGPGHFNAVVRKRARSIHMDRCTGCRACVEACPVTAYTNQPILTKFVKVVSEVTEKIRALGPASRFARHLPPHSTERVAS